MLLNLEKLLSFSVKLSDRVIVFWNNININPNPNSTADKTKKKNVNEIKLLLSKIKPANKVIVYKVIHKISAVNKRFIDVVVFTNKVKKIKKKNKIDKFKLSIVIILTNILKEFNLK